jgi:hypothetical protein
VSIQPAPSRRASCGRDANHDARSVWQRLSALAGRQPHRSGDDRNARGFVNDKLGRAVARAQLEFIVREPQGMTFPSNSVGTVGRNIDGNIVRYRTIIVIVRYDLTIFSQGMNHRRCALKLSQSPSEHRLLSCEVVTKGPLGSFQVNVSADADMGSGVETITGVLAVQVVASQAASLNIVAMEPESRI